MIFVPSTSANPSKAAFPVSPEVATNIAKDISKVNDDVFVMPEHDVHIRGTWAKQSIVKAMDGTVHEKTTLYKVLQNEAATGTYAKEYTGSHQDSMDASKSTFFLAAI